MSKFKVGDEVAIAALVKITAIQPTVTGKVSYSTDRGLCIHETLMDEIALARKEPKAEEPKPASQTARRFKVGDRVETEFGTGEIVFICDKDLDIPYLVYNENWDGCSGYLAEGFDVHKYRGRCKWFCERLLSPAPAPEPPKKSRFPLSEEELDKVLYEIREVARQQREKEEPKKTTTLAEAARMFSDAWQHEIDALYEKMLDREDD